MKINNYSIAIILSLSTGMMYGDFNSLLESAKQGAIEQATKAKQVVIQQAEQAKQAVSEQIEKIKQSIGLKSNALEQAATSDDLYTLQKNHLNLMEASQLVAKDIQNLELQLTKLGSQAKAMESQYGAVRSAFETTGEALAKRKITIYDAYEKNNPGKAILPIESFDFSKLDPSIAKLQVANDHSLQILTKIRNEYQKAVKAANGIKAQIAEKTNLAQQIANKDIEVRAKARAIGQENALKKAQKAATSEYDVAPAQRSSLSSIKPKAQPTVASQYDVVPSKISIPSGEPNAQSVVASEYDALPKPSSLSSIKSEAQPTVASQYDVVPSKVSIPSGELNAQPAVASEYDALPKPSTPVQ